MEKPNSEYVAGMMLGTKGARVSKVLATARLTPQYELYQAMFL